MRCEWLDEYLLSFPGAEKDYQPVWKMFLYKVRGKQFAAVCSPGENYRTYGGHDLVNLKCGAAEGELLRARYPDILPGFYSDKLSGYPAGILLGQADLDLLPAGRGSAGGGPAGPVQPVLRPGSGKAAEIRPAGAGGAVRGELRCFQWQRKKRKRPM